MIAISRSAVVLLTAALTALSAFATGALAANGKVMAASPAPSPGIGDLAGFVATPQTGAAGNQIFLIAPEGSWFLATSLGAPGARMIDMKSGVALRFLRSPGLSIAGLSISADGKAVFARDYDGRMVAWDSTTGQLVEAVPRGDLRDVTHLSLQYEGNDPATADLLSRYHIHSHFPQLKQFDQITLNPTRDYAIVGYTDDSEWKTFQVWNLKEERAEVSFRLESTGCGNPPFAFDYDGRHIVFGNTGGGCDPNHLDFTVFEIQRTGAEPKFASASRILGGKCSIPDDIDGGSSQSFAISASGQLIARSGDMPGSPEWAAWDLRTGEKVASIKPDGGGIISDDDGTIVVVNDPQEIEGAASSQQMTVLRHGKQTTFKVPAALRSETASPLVLSANGRWLAWTAGDRVAVWSTQDGKPLREYRVGAAWTSRILRLSDSGDPLLVNEQEGTAFVQGKWHAVRSDRDEPGQESLIVPLTPNFHPQCGIIVCDHVIAELGVVERKPRDDRARGDVRRNFSPDGRFLTVYLAQKGIGEGIDVIDVADGHVALHLDDGYPQFTLDGRFIVVRDATLGSFAKYDIATGKRVWTAFPNRYLDGFYMLLADGHVRYSRSRQIDLALVRGFEVRPFDAETAKQFTSPPDR